MLKSVFEYLSYLKTMQDKDKDNVHDKDKPETIFQYYAVTCTGKIHLQNCEVLANRNA